MAYKTILVSLNNVPRALIVVRQLAKVPVLIIPQKGTLREVKSVVVGFDATR